MPRPKTLDVEFRCKICKFHLGLKGTEKEINVTVNSLIKKHNDYYPDCKASKFEDFIVKPIEEEDRHIIEAKKLIIKRLDETEKAFKTKDYKLDDIIGNEEVKEILKSRLVNYIEHKEKLSKLKKYPSSGIILAGIQGTGKTLVILSAINDIIISNKEYKKKFNVIVLKSHDFMSGTVGESGKKIESVLDIIRKFNKENDKETILIIDEIDNLAPDRETRSVLTSERTGSLLDEFGGIHDDHTIFLMGTTNKPDRIDSEALVAGRFGNPLLVNIPTKDERYKMFKKFTSDLNLEESVDNEYFVNEKFNKFSGRDLHQFTTDLQIIYYEKERKGEHNSEPVITQDDIEDLLETPNYRNTNTFNLERINKLSGYYSKYNEEVTGADKTVDNEDIINKFIRTHLEIVSESVEFLDDVFEEYEKWEEHIPMVKSIFSRTILKDKRIIGCRPVGKDGRQHSAYTNIKLKK